jgi:hypothetical protein
MRSTRRMPVAVQVALTAASLIAIFAGVYVWYSHWTLYPP